MWLVRLSVWVRDDEENVTMSGDGVTMPERSWWCLIMSSPLLVTSLDPPLWLSGLSFPRKEVQVSSLLSMNWRAQSVATVCWWILSGTIILSFPVSTWLFNLNWKTSACTLNKVYYHFEHSICQIIPPDNQTSIWFIEHKKCVQVCLCLVSKFSDCGSFSTHRIKFSYLQNI